MDGRLGIGLYRTLINDIDVSGIVLTSKIDAFDNRTIV